MFGVLKNLFWGWKLSHIVSEWSWVWQSCWCHLRKSWCRQQSSLFWFPGLLSVHFEPLVIIIEMGGDLGCNNIQKYGDKAVCKTTYMTSVKGQFISVRWNCHGNRGIKIEKVPANYVKSFSRVLLSLLEKLLSY